MKKYILVLASIVLLTDIFVCMVKYNQTADNAKTYFANLIEQQRIVAQKQVDSIFNNKDLKESKQTLLKRILSKCNPKEYVKNYDGHLLDIANNIYRQAIITDVNDDEEIMKLASLAESGLGIVLISKSDIRSLKKSVIQNAL